MKNKLFATLVALSISSLLTTVFAVPAYPGWRTMEQPDGTTIELRLVGDEFYHYWINRDGQQVTKNEAGYYVVATEQLTKAQIAARRAASPRRSAIRKGTGEPSPKPYGLVILVNFSDKTFETAHTLSLANTMMNADSYTHDGAYGSVRKYFSDQSNGAYTPQYDVVGPVTLSKSYDHYGEGEDDNYIGDFVMDACTLAKNNFSVDFTKYDSDNDGYVDFVYFLYAWHGAADYNDDDCIWPHNWSLESALYYNMTESYKKSTFSIGGKKIDNYACSSELEGDGAWTGIATICHEFSHVIGIPDAYDVVYGDNYKNNLTPGDYHLMDGGSYNNGGKNPPSYTAFDKYYMGWATPTNLHEAQNVVLTTNYGDYYQINAAGTLKAYSYTSDQYYLENRQKTGWDAYNPGAGMLVWRIKYNQDIWEANEPNAGKNGNNDPSANTTGAVNYELVVADNSHSDGGDAGDPFPGSKNKTSYTPITGYPLTEIAQTGSNITFKFMGGVSCHNITSNATNCTVAPSVSCVENGNGFTATITPVDATYDITSVTVKRGTTNLTSGTHYTLSADKKTLTVNASAVTGSASDAFTITAVATKNRCTYGVLSDPDVCTISSAEGTITINSALNLTITASGYYLGSASCWEVEMGGSTLTYGTGFTYNTSTGAFSITKVTGNVEIYVYPNYTVTWSVDGVTTPAYFAKDAALVLPATPSDCSSGDKVFVGWTADGTFSGGDTAPDDLFTTAGTKTVTGNITYYAVYATESSSAPIRKAGATADSVYTFTNKDWASVPANRWTKNIAGAGYSNSGVQFTAASTSGNATSKTSFNNISKIVVSYCTNAKNGAGTIDVTIGSNAATKTSVTKTGGTTARNLEFTYSTPQSGTVTLGATCTTNSIYICGITITASTGGGKTYSDYALNCAPVVPVDPECSFATTSKTLTFGESFTQTLTTNSNGAISYSSSNTGVATVDNSGVITTTGIGNTTIYGSTAATAKYNAGTNCASYTITVNKVSPVVTFTSPTTSVQNGQSVTNTATVTPSGYTITYSSNNEAVATVDNSGKITTVSTGKATITATVAEGATWNQASDNYTLTVTEAPSLQVTWSTPNGNLTDAQATHMYITGEALLMPTTTPSCAGRTFEGWTATADYTSKDAAPSDIFTTAGSKTVTSNVTYYAVFH